jgi:hypothetical protein
METAIFAVASALRLAASFCGGATVRITVLCANAAGMSNSIRANLE